MSADSRIHSLRSDILSEWETIREKMPDAVAVCDGEESLTYESLSRDSDDWGRCLNSERRGPVMIHSANGCFLAGAILGSLKAGRVCVPLAGNTPIERVRQLVECSGADALISNDPELLEKVSEWAHPPELFNRAIATDAGTEQVENRFSESPSEIRLSDRPAFLMYTSGTEGKPKPVMLLHGNIVRECRHFRDSFGLREGDRASWFHASSVLAGLRELLMSLLSGGTVSAFNYAECGAEKMADWLNRERITGCRFVPTMFRQFCSSLDASMTFPSVRVFYIGGERVLLSDLDLFNRHFPNAEQFSMVYGSTETGLCLENSIPAGNDNSSSDNLPLGRPVPGYELRIAERESDGSGELVVSGDCVNVVLPAGQPLSASIHQEIAKGSLEHFSGDSVREDAQGNWCFVGRAGDFVKIDGNRVGLEEVRTSVSQLEFVEDCRVQKENGKLIVFTKFADGKAVPTVEKIRTRLLANLPPYMVPSEFHAMKEIPLTPGGKVDRERLRPPSQKATGRSSRQTRSWSSIERMVGDVWAITLGRSKIELEDSFFSLGGSSLMAVIAASRLSVSLGRSVPPSHFASYPSLQATAAALEALPPDDKWSVVVPLRRSGTKPPLFLFHPVGGGVMSYLPLIAKLESDRPVIGLQAYGLDGVSTPSTTVAEAARRFLPEILRINPLGPFLLAGHSFGGRVAFEAACQLRKREYPVSFVGLFDSHPTATTRNLPTTEAIRFMGARVRFHFARLAHMSSSQRKAWFRRFARKLSREARLSEVTDGGDLQSDLASLSNSISRVRNCCLKASKDYSPRNYAGNVTLFKAKTPGLEIRPDFDYGWGEVAEGGVKVIEVSGSHTSILLPQNVDSFAIKFRRALSNASDTAEIAKV